MATRIKILSYNKIKAFDSPPEFSDEERKRFFDLPKWANDLIENFRTPTSKVGFILQLGYFKAVNKFFVASNFYRKDIEFVAQKLDIPIENIHFGTYNERTLRRHHKIILENLGFCSFDEQSKIIVVKEAMSLSSKQIKPKLMFLSLIDFIRQKKIEVPSYNILSEIITNVLKHFEKELISSIEKHITPKEKNLLNNLLEFDEKYLTEEKKELKIKRYKITLLKKSKQSTRPSKIKENIEDLECLKALFDELNPIIEQLDLTPEIIMYYSQIVVKSQVFQINRREDKKYLFLISFVINQYYRLNDLLIEILMQAVQSSLNNSAKEHKEKIYESRRTRHQAINDLSEVLNDNVTTLKRIDEIINRQELTDEEKVKAIKVLLSNEKKTEYSETQEQLALLKKESRRIIKNDDYYDILETKSIKLQNRVSEIVKHIDFDKESSNKNIIEAIDYYKKKDGILGADVPIKFLDESEQEIVFNEKGKLRTSLYKVFLFEKIASAIKSGSLNLKYSYKYRAFDDYLIPKNVWEEQKEELIERAGLTEFKNFEDLESNLKQDLKLQFQKTNEDINTEKNKYAKIDARGDLKISTPKVEKDITDTTADLFPKNQFISLFEVLSTINDLSNFSESFEHWQIKHNRNKPPEKTFFAGIIGYGCNIGIRKIAKISRNIKQNELENTVNWYFSNDNLNRANDNIVELTEQLKLPIIFKKERYKTHTSSDGQKFSISVDSLNANYSYKYFGKDKGVSVYSFIDESNRLFYSTVISSAEREAPYVIDGLMHNDVVQSDIHSTDTHGYSEIIFAVTYLLGILFAPRIKNFKRQRPYSFEKISYLKNLDYKILPYGRINTKIIRDNWDDILRFIATIKLNETTASQLFRRLNSYSRQHPLYKALKEFGKIIKTIFLLTYIDNLELRQAIEKQLNKLESSNKFGKAVFYGNNQEFQQETKEEQLIAEGCKRLIENAIICWNYLYLSQLVYDSKEEHKEKLIQTIKNGSAVTWQHINLQGEYDFSEEILKDSIKFKLPKLLDLEMD